LPAALSGGGALQRSLWRSGAACAGDREADEDRAGSRKWRGGTARSIRSAIPLPGCAGERQRVETGGANAIGRISENECRGAFISAGLGCRGGACAQVAG